MQSPATVPAEPPPVYEATTRAEPSSSVESFSDIAPSQKTASAARSQVAPSPLSSSAATAVHPPQAPAAVATAPLSSLSSTKNAATQRKVAKLLDITTSSDIKDLASYVDEVLPGYFYTKDADDGSSNNVKGREDGEAVVTSGHFGSRTITSTTLRSALDHRAIDMHRNFLHEFTAVYENFQRVATKVDELQAKCTGLEKVLSTSTGGSAGAADEFFYQIQMHQAELQLVQHHEKEVDDFRKQHHFGPAEQQVLEDGPVDMNFLNVLERAREVHRHSSELMQSQEYHQGAAAVMEATYAAVARATEKIARHLLATAGTAGGAAGRGDVHSAATSGGVGAIAADVPEVTGFQLRCVRLLYEESPSLHAKFVDEVARLRRASVLRRYFHLLTTGSANTASGMYQSGGQPRGGTADTEGPGMGTRPLEAELNNPTYFFSSLCAWLHQTIVEEEDFLHSFFMNDEGEAQTARRGAARGPASGSAHVVLVDTERLKQDAAHQRVMLDSVFGGVCKHIRAALDNVLERLGRSAASLGAAKGDAQSGGGEGGAADNVTPAPHKGPRGLTGGLTRLFMAATGRAPLASFRRKDSDDSSALLQRYASVTTRAQQEAVASSALHAPLQGVQTCVTLVQLFEYYSVTTFTPLLGEGSALTKLISETAPQQTREVFQRLLRVLSAHLLDSTAGVIYRTATLRRLASSNALSNSVTEADGAKPSSNAASPSSVYILQFLTSMTYGEDAEAASNTSMSGVVSNSRTDLGASMPSTSFNASTANAKFRQASDGQLQRHNAQELKRVLSQLVLPPSPEVAAYCSVLTAVLRDTARQADLLQAISDQHQHAAEASETASTVAAFRLRTEVKSVVRELLRALWRAAQSVQEDGTLRDHLDDPCRAILQYNILYQLQGIMEGNSDVLEVLCEAAVTVAATEPGLGVESAVDMREELEWLRAEVGAAMNALRRRLLSQWEEAVAHFYFPLSTNAVAAASASSASAGAEAEEPHNMGAKKNMRRVLKQVMNVYNTIASAGRLPEPVPLLPALCGGETMQKEVSAEITKSVVERVYPAEFDALAQLPPNEELAAVQEEMSPANLAVLVDFTSPAAAAL